MPSFRETDSGERLREYELAYLGVAEDASAALVNVLKARGIEPASQRAPALIQLAYPIKKRPSAYFGWFQFVASPDTADQIVRDLKHEASVLRSLLVTSPLKPAVASAKPERIEQASKPEVVPEPQALTNEALEQKLEEILK